ncbi:carbohydrate ABC transporter permease [Brachybacterium fresconis]|uniref:Multiple sugar transport system permease protein n=1 Tax=Brachybacterium fresconis TaxID=173363 RepID=A0ABS4YKB6_9MICO|nr:sugar ABC transporter permease [Brachybacterium fresconis]MBP2409174.1 multiple sugar transport system permease protein [Brachybacterium fresconis]
MTAVRSRPPTTNSQAASPQPRRGRSGPRRTESRWGLLLAAPAGLHVLIWTGFPVLAAFIFSFTDYDMIERPGFIGIANYIELLGDTIFWKGILNNLIIAVVGIPISMLAALVLATLLNRGLRGEGLFRTLVFLPHVTATVAVAMIWLWIYAPTGNGLANMALSALGLPQQAWLTDASLALPAVIVVTIWQGIGLKMLIYLASLQGIPQELYEAAEIDGAGPVQKFFRITVPMLKPATFFVLVTSIIANFQTFDLIYNLTSGGPANSTTVVTYEIYQTAFQQFRMGLATAQSVVLLLILVLLTIISRKLVGGTDND